MLITQLKYGVKRGSFSHLQELCRYLEDHPAVFIACENITSFPQQWWFADRASDLVRILFRFVDDPIRGDDNSWTFPGVSEKYLRILQRFSGGDNGILTAPETIDQVFGAIWQLCRTADFALELGVLFFDNTPEREQGEDEEISLSDQIMFLGWHEARRKFTSC